MKKFFVMAVVGLLAATSCSNESEVTVCNETETAPVHVRVRDFSMSVEGFSDSRGRTRTAEDPADCDEVGAITLAFYNGTTEVYKVTQVKSDISTYNTFGEFSCHLPVGNYTMVAVGYGLFSGDAFSLDSPTAAGYSSEKARETFVATQTVHIANTNAVELSATLERVVSALKIISTDGRPDHAKKIRTTYAAGGKSFNPTTGLATVNTGFAVEVSPSTPANSTIEVKSFLFLASDEQDINITIDVLDANDDVLFTKQIPNVPFKRNRMTFLTGSVFSATSLTSAAFQVETGWLTNHTANF